MLELLEFGELSLTGRLVDSSNNAMVGTVCLDDVAVACVYKPARGERPLWDFPGAVLARREVATFLVAQTAGWHCVPPTVYRDGPFGPGMVQQWIDGAESSLVADLFPEDDVPPNWLPVLRARDDDDNLFVLAHADSLPLKTIALLDAVTNNADRKASHVLARADGTILGVDHGLTFHREPKLRTIVWGWAGQPVPTELIAGLDALAANLAPGGTLSTGLAQHLPDEDISAVVRRVDAMRQQPIFPLPPSDRTAIPWPPL